MPTFNHLHVHTQFSLLDGAAPIGKLFKKAKADGQRAVAITDHGNMFGVFKFVADAKKHGVKPIIGCEFYLVADRHRKTFNKENKDERYHQLLLAKNEQGYRNLSKLCSIGFIEGMYSKYPRIDKEVLLKYHGGLIATTCCLGAEVPQAIMHGDERKAEELFKWWLDLFGEDYYVELQRHKLDEQKRVNEVLLKFAAKYKVPIIASNDSHYVDQEDFTAHDILLCVNTGELKSTPVWKEEGSSPKGYRFGFANSEFYFKSTAEMAKLFDDLPQALDNTNEIVDKCWDPKLESEILLPHFPLPPGFDTPDAFLETLTFDGARKRYGEDLDDTVVERLRFELDVIKKMGFAGYFLIVQDFIRAGRNLGVSIGPGRGSAAGSAVAYAIGITNIDPIKYSLLFERFLNPERVSMPDMDIDFDDQGRQKVIDYVVDKYGRNQVAQIITFGSMAAKSSIKDVARVLDLPLAEANALAKLVPEKPGTTLEGAFAEVPELREIRAGNDLRAEVLREAEKLEGSVRNTGIHAAGLIIAPRDVTDCVPVAVAKDSDLLVTQFDGKVIESAGLLKMDFLGLKTLTIIRDALANIKKGHGVEIDIDAIPLDDEKTYQLYQRGDTVATFQFESDGMRQYLKDLKPTNIEDLIAMNALYRPGPMQFIPNFINRKQGREVVEYPHNLLEPILNYTYGIMVYQEQIMQTAQILAGYTLGGADMLRRAMGKKDKEKMAKERIKFVDGAKALHGIAADHANAVFDTMERFAEYGFNRSHSAAYSVVAYQTGYLKAHYPAEYMASVLTHSIGSIEDITFFTEEAKRFGIAVLGPDVNASERNFSVDASGAIRFGLAAIKGVGEGAVDTLIAERDAKGPYLDVFDLMGRLAGSKLNRKAMESLVYAGALDGFGYDRAMYFQDEAGSIFLERAMRFGALVAQEKANAVTTLFGSSGDVNSLPRPKYPATWEPWSNLTRLGHEKEATGFYLSGHPLDPYKLEIKTLCTANSSNWGNFKNQEVWMAAIVSGVAQKRTKTDRVFITVQLEDLEGSFELALFGNDVATYGSEFLVGRALMIRFRVAARFGNQEQYELKPLKFLELQMARAELMKGLRLDIDVAQLASLPRQALADCLKKHSGKGSLYVYLHDRTKGVSLQTLARSYRVNMSNELLAELEELGFGEPKLLRG